MSFYTEQELHEMGFQFIGKQVLLSRKASIYNAGRISIGDFSRIDDFCVLSAGEGGIFIGRNVHLSCHSSLLGKGKIEIGDFCAISVRATLFSSSDDCSGNAMINPTVPEAFTNVYHGDVIIGKHVLSGAGSIILPGVKIGTGVVIGALSLVNKDCEAFWIYAGCPAQKIKKRKEDLLALEKEFLDKTTRDV